MSDPVKNVEIEDVLSSIRRLVSADDRLRDGGGARNGTPLQHDTDLAADAAADAAQDEKLVLTPAQRVDSVPDPVDQSLDDEVFEARLAEAIGDGLDEEGEKPTAARLRDEFYDDIEDAEILQDEAETADEVALRADDDVLRFVHQPDDRPGDDHAEGETDEVETPESVVEDAGTDPIDVPEFLKRRSMPDDAVVDAGPGGADESFEAASDLSFGLKDEDDDAPDGEAELVEPRVEGTVPTESESAPDNLDFDDLEARIAGVEEAVAQQEDTWDPDGDARDANAAQAAMSPLPWSDLSEEQPDEPASDSAVADYVAKEEAPDQESVPIDQAERTEPIAQDQVAEEDIAEPTHAKSDWFDEDAVLDEDALRDMVSEIVRQELQGALGERITRNVRKLVRREINRALLGQGIE